MPLAHKSCASRIRACIVAVALFCIFSATAQTYPLKPIRVVVTNPNGDIDAYARVFQPKFAEIIGQPMVLENHPEASGAIGAKSIARSAPDGYSLLFATSAVLGATRFARLPEVTSITDTLPGFRPAPLWSGMFAPAATPRPIVQRLLGLCCRAQRGRSARAISDQGIPCDHRPALLSFTANQRSPQCPVPSFPWNKASMT